MDHIKPERLLHFINVRVDLSGEEQAHLAECEPCLTMFNTCILAPKTNDDTEELWRKKAA